MNAVVGRADVLFVTFDCLRYDVAVAAPTVHLPRWERRETPGTFTLPAAGVPGCRRAGDEPARRGLRRSGRWMRRVAEGGAGVRGLAVAAAVRRPAAARRVFLPDDGRPWRGVRRGRPLRPPPRPPGR